MCCKHPRQCMGAYRCACNNYVFGVFFLLVFFLLFDFFDVDFLAEDSFLAGLSFFLADDVDFLLLLVELFLSADFFASVFFTAAFFVD